MNGAWRNDGPALPIEFGRRSRDDRLTLVLVSGVLPQNSLWAPLDVSSLSEAIQCLNEREGRPGSNRIGRWPCEKEDEKTGQREVADWAEQRDLEGVVWTALPPRFDGEERFPKLAEVLAYLRGLDGDKRELAEEYIRRAPSQIRTSYRAEIEKELGWRSQ